MSPTYDRSARFLRDIRKLTGQQRREFLAARDRMVAGLRSRPPAFDPALRVKRVQGTDDTWEMTWAEDGRATFRYGAEIKPGEPHVIW
ncbi:MAG: hypothetical protein ACRDK2_06445, partial [Solirubrobacteraceae bacterium]